jgi:hypothetical protein
MKVRGGAHGPLTAPGNSACSCAALTPGRTNASAPTPARGNWLAPAPDCGDGGVPDGWPAAAPFTLHGCDGPGAAGLTASVSLARGTGGGAIGIGGSRERRSLGSAGDGRNCGGLKSRPSDVGPTAPGVSTKGLIEGADNV